MTPWNLPFLIIKSTTTKRKILIRIDSKCPRYDTKLHLVVRLQFYSSVKLGVTPPLLLLPAALWPGVLITVWLTSMFLKVFEMILKKTRFCIVYSRRWLLLWWLWYKITQQGLTCCKMKQTIYNILQIKIIINCLWYLMKNIQKRIYWLNTHCLCVCVCVCACVRFRNYNLKMEVPVV